MGDSKAQEQGGGRAEVIVWPCVIHEKLISIYVPGALKVASELLLAGQLVGRVGTLQDVMW